MILQALNAYYQRLADDPDQDVPRPGYSNEKMYFALVLSPQGKLLDIHELRRQEKKKKLPQEMVVPHWGPSRSGTKPRPFFLWDNTGYVLGADAKGKPERALECFQAFRDLIHRATAGPQAPAAVAQDAGLAAVRAFLAAWESERAAEAIGAFLPWEDVAGWNVVFRLDGEQGYVHERLAARAAWDALRSASGKGDVGFCLITGQNGPMARLHPFIKGVRGAKTTGAALVSFNCDAFTSHGKEQNFNAPVSEAATFAYSTALNHLLRRGSRRTVQIGDTTTVFWTEAPAGMEELFGLFLGARMDDDAAEGAPAEDGGTAQKVRAALEAIRDGKSPAELGDAAVGFYVLGLAPNAARLAVRFFEATSVGEMGRRLRRHFRALAMERRSEREPEFPGLWQLLIELAPLRKTENIPPVLGGAIMRAILAGRPYPHSLLTTIIARIRADHEVSYLRAALLKAYFTRAQGAQHKEVCMTLDTAKADIGYRLGRLFAVLEKAQRDALPGINATIKDRFYGAASATPRAVFPNLLRLAQHHIAKVKSKSKRGFISDKRLGEIMEDLPAFPAHLSVAEQGEFALGYYQQRNALWRKAEADGQTTNPDTAA